MTAVDELAPDEVDRAMYKQKAWKRIVVMSGGIAMNFLLGFVLIIVLAVGWGLPISDNRAVVGNTVCVSPTQAWKTAATNWRSARVTARPRWRGSRAGDVITAVNGESTPTFTDLVRKTQPLSGTADFTVERDGQTLTIAVPIQQVQRYVTIRRRPPRIPGLRSPARWARSASRRRPDREVLAAGGRARVGRVHR